MITVRPSHERGLTQIDWLSSKHSFSFGDYYDPKHMHFRTLRVINQDIIQPGKGFGLHPHHDMEILTYIIRGTLEHRDSLGNHGVIQAGEVQRMTTGTGIMHSEFNSSTTEPVELLQIWILPAQKQLTPNYQQKAFARLSNQLQLLASPTGELNSLPIHQDIKVYRGLLDNNQRLAYIFPAKRYAWLQLVKGQLQVDNEQLKVGDGAAIQLQSEISLMALEDSEFLLFELS